MTSPKSAAAPATSDDSPRIEHAQPLVRTQELPALDARVLDDEEPDAATANAVPCAIADEVTVPVQSSIESTLTFEVLRRQSIETDDDDEIP